MGRPEILDRLWNVIRERGRTRPQGSYVVSLLEGGHAAMAAKLREEAEELIEASRVGDRAASAHEAADLLFHAWVLLAASDVAPAAVYEELERRFGTGGLVEKARRGGDATGGGKAC